MGTSATKAKNKYNSQNYERINFTIPKGEKELIKAAADAAGESVNSFIYKAVKTRLETVKMD